MLETHDKGVILCPVMSLEITFYVNEEFCGTWDKIHAQNEPCTSRSWGGFVAGAPVFWQSKLQTMIALSTTKSELIVLSEGTQFIQLLSYLKNELHQRKMVAMKALHFLKIMKLLLIPEEYQRYSLIRNT
jgi:hypothetical protein